VQRCWSGWLALPRIPAREHTRTRIIPPRAQVHQPIVVQLAGEAERLGCCAALGQGGQPRDPPKLTGAPALEWWCSPITEICRAALVSLSCTTEKCRTIQRWNR
jgi:hypothetical protein